MALTNVVGNGHVAVAMRGSDGEQTRAQQVAVAVLQVIGLDTMRSDSSLPPRPMTVHGMLGTSVELHAFANIGLITLHPL